MALTLLWAFCTKCSIPITGGAKSFMYGDKG